MFIWDDFNFEDNIHGITFRPCSMLGILNKDGSGDFCAITPYSAEHTIGWCDGWYMDGDSIRKLISLGDLCRIGNPVLDTTGAENFFNTAFNFTGFEKSSFEPVFNGFESGNPCFNFVAVIHDIADFNNFNKLDFYHTVPFSSVKKNEKVHDALIKNGFFNTWDGKFSQEVYDKLFEAVSTPLHVDKCDYKWIRNFLLSHNHPPRRNFANAIFFDEKKGKWYSYKTSNLDKATLFNRLPNKYIRSDLNLKYEEFYKKAIKWYHFEEFPAGKSSVTDDLTEYDPDIRQEKHRELSSTMASISSLNKSTFNPLGQKMLLMPDGSTTVIDMSDKEKNDYIKNNPPSKVWFDRPPSSNTYR